MTRGLSAGQINVLDDNAIIVETLIQIVLNNVSVFFTDGQTDTTATTLTSGGSQIFQVGKFSNISQIKDTDFTTEFKVAIQYGGDPAIALSPISTIPLNYPNLTTRFIFNKLFRNLSDNTILSAPIQVFDGTLVKKTYITSNEEKYLTFDLLQKSRFASTYSPFLNSNNLGVI